MPEVETIVHALRNGGRLSEDGSASPSILGRKITAVELLWQRTLVEPGRGLDLAMLPGQTIHEISRRGKFLIFHLDRNVLLIHLRMSGDLLVRMGEAPPAPHDRFALTLDNGPRLVFNDPRKFGRVWLATNEDDLLAGLGPEPFSAEFTPEWLYSALQARRRQLKPLLLDQNFLAGLGNIYSDEALHRAWLHPLRLSDSISREEAARLWRAIRAVLEEGIQRNGSSIDWVYRGGDFQNYFRVYQRAGEPCPVCGTLVERMVIGQRSTHFCPKCQMIER
ncbi:MAG TPA: bifunctional DNA-formamidopyrimidine glycosylase/DNA-(apurinic or apyrimidinic site) lyase [Anaerolineaceae bacterium]|nr:bifunctional DNA-formamidopyrimidine glycosylase/DNA-(apurinic or apyrimidinic site) lyase [Anaerolineaceae bacterium]